MQGLPGFVDAQLLFHDNGRSKGVGVALFGSRPAAEGAVEALSGRQADGRRLDLLVMSPDNHISFSSAKVTGRGGLFVCATPDWAPSPSPSLSASASASAFKDMLTP